MLSRGDVVVAAVAAAVDGLVCSDLLTPLAGGNHTPRWFVVGATMVGAALLLSRRRWPGPVLALLCVHSEVGSLFTSYRPTVMVCVALASAVGRSRLGPVSGAALVGVAVIPGWVDNEIRTASAPLAPGVGALLAVAYLGVLAAAVGLGRWQRAGVLERRMLARMGAEEARHAVEAERKRMARELHDIVGHAVTVMMLQAAGARRVMATDMERAGQALQAVEDLGAQAMGELHRLLGLLRAQAGEPDGHPDQGGRPGLANLTELLDSFRAAGIRIEVVQQGRPGSLDPSVDLTCYRLVQEALTNVSKYAAAAARAVVRVEWEGELVRICVENEGGDSAADSRLRGGRGLLGLSERVSVAGGSLEAGRRPGGGYRVAATLPCATRRPPDFSTPK